jgi:hypothetical protein
MAGRTQQIKGTKISDQNIATGKNITIVDNNPHSLSAP